MAAAVVCTLKILISCFSYWFAPYCPVVKSLEYICSARNQQKWTKHFRWHTNLLSRLHFEAVPECCAQSLPVAARVTTPLKILAKFDKLSLSPSSRGNTALQRRYSTAMSRGLRGRGLHWLVHKGSENKIKLLQIEQSCCKFEIVAANLK